MYNLLLYGHTDYHDWENNRAFRMEIGWVFRSTHDDIKNLYRGSDQEPDFDALRKLPCLFTYEGHDVMGFIGYINDAKRDGRDVYFTYTLSDLYPRICLNKSGVFNDLGIVNRYERTTSHWAVKDVDLFEVVTRMLYSEPGRQNVLSDDEMKSLWGDDYKGKTLLFLCHRAKYEDRVSEIKRSLEKERVRCFVAHDNITPGSTWSNQIVNALNTMDVFFGFATDDFHEGSWTDQEIGYAHRRNVPRRFVKLGHKEPKGFVSPEQALTTNWEQAAGAIIEDLKAAKLL